MAGDDQGTYFLPEIGDEVLVAAEQGHPARLYVLGMLWNGEHVPPADNDDGANNTRLIKSRSGHLIRFNDDESGPEVEVRLSDGKMILLDQDGITIIDGDRSVISLTSTSGAMQIKAAQELSIDRPQHLDRGHHHDDGQVLGDAHPQGLAGPGQLTADWQASRVVLSGNPPEAAGDG